VNYILFAMDFVPKGRW